MKDLFNDTNYDIMDLSKAGGSHLVPKKVVVHKDGKTFMATRYVNPNKDDVSTDSSPKGTEEAPKKPPTDTGIGSGETYADASERAVETYKADQAPPKKPKVSTHDKTCNDALESSGLHLEEGLKGYYQGFNNIKNHVNFTSSKGGYSDGLDTIFNLVMTHLPEISKQITKDIDNTPDQDMFVKNVQKGVVKKNLDSYDDLFATVGSHPTVLKHGLMHLLGKKFYLELRDKIKDSNLTINTAHAHMESILKDGYKPKTIVDFITKDSRPNKVDTHLDIWDKLLNDTDPEDSWDALDTLAYNEDSIWISIQDRLIAERDTMCLDMVDDRPCYIAYNANGGAEGGAPGYGDGSVVQIDNSVLRDCTVSDDDSFFSNSCIPKIYSKDHLDDIMILRLISDNATTGNSKKSDREYIRGLDLKELKKGSNMPLEIQYHRTAITPDKISVFNKED